MTDWYTKRKEERKAAGLRQCGRGKHSYSYKDRAAEEYFVTCLRCGKRVHRRERDHAYGDRGLNKREIH